MTADMVNSETRTVPDPSTLTTDQLLREITNLRSYIDSALDNLRDYINVALVTGKELTEEKLSSVGTQFGLVERGRVEQKNDTKAAVDAALAAAKEAVKEQTTAFGLATAKSETATAEQLKQLTVTFTTAINGVTAVITDTKTRVERLENFKQGNKEGITAIYAFIAFLVSLVILGTILSTAGVFK